MLVSDIHRYHRRTRSRGSHTLLVTTEIEGGETVVTNSKFLGGRVGCGLQNGDTVVLFNALISKLPNPDL